MDIFGCRLKQKKYFNTIYVLDSLLINHKADFSTLVNLAVGQLVLKENDCQILVFF